MRDEADTRCEPLDARYERTHTGEAPRWICACAFVAKGDTWAEAGQAIDDHIDQKEHVTP